MSCQKGGTERHPEKYRCHEHAQAVNHHRAQYGQSADVLLYWPCDGGPLLQLPVW